MATYKEIKGVTVQALDADPVEFVGSWASGGNLNTAREGFSWCRHIRTAAWFSWWRYHLLNTAIVEQYNGTSWTEANDLNTARQYLGALAGTQTAAYSFVGRDQSPPCL